ncbi:MAG: FAD-dependent oxidoreductase [Lachnospiraceae bacterium]|nr:FAD-dependent oxidoreductase [Lachnospiraceae bacterium]
MIRLNSLRLEIGYTEQDLLSAVRKRLKIGDKHPFSHEIVRLSLDARKKDDIHYTCSVDVKTYNENEILKDKRIKNISVSEPVVYDDPFDKLSGTAKAALNSSKRPVITGFGPAGMLAGYKLAKAGLRPIIVERGCDVDTRIADVNAFWNGGKLDPESNVQFGEGGAGTFSDGKLNTMIHDKFGRITEFFRIFIENGADPSIRYINKPHIGTDRLTEIVRNIRKEIIACGGEVRFRTKLTGLDIKNGALRGIYVNAGEYIECDTLILALGHSARDTFEMLLGKGLNMEKKAFAMGVRIQHPQEVIGRAQYGEAYKKLPAADYKLTYQASNGRGVYSFCMCPGGFVVNASSEEGRLAVNGLSNSDRSEATANSALVVNLREDDLAGDSPLAGMELQRRLEKAAYKEGRGKIPVQYYADFVKNRESSISDNTESSADKTCDQTLLPNTKGAYTGGNLKNILPAYISESIEEAMPVFGKTIKGFDSPEALMIGLESRTSSPVRITRNDDLESVSVKGIYPCGEGAGYAGGITSAAVDGIKVYEAIIQKLLHDQTEGC